MNIAEVNCDTLSRDDMSKKQNFLQSESTLTEFGIELMVMKPIQNNTEMSCMLFFTLKIDQDVINEDHDKLVQLRLEYGVHQYMKCAVALVSSNDIIKYSYNPYLVEKAVLEMSYMRILI
jgi:hypothetical protein